MSIASATPPDDSAVSIDPPRHRWYNKLLGLLFAILCFEMGIFLIAFPWSSYWARNFFSWLSPEWREIWMNPYFRGNGQRHRPAEPLRIAGGGLPPAG